MAAKICLFRISFILLKLYIIRNKFYREIFLFKTLMNFIFHFTRTHFSKKWTKFHFLHNFFHDQFHRWKKVKFHQRNFFDFTWNWILSLVIIVIRPTHKFRYKFQIAGLWIPAWISTIVLHAISDVSHMFVRKSQLCACDFSNFNSVDHRNTFAAQVTILVYGSLDGSFVWSLKYLSKKIYVLYVLDGTE